MWTEETRPHYDRSHLRYPSDLTDEEWALIAELIPPARRGGRPRTVDVREVLNAVLFVLSTGCQWHSLPKDLPPRSTAHKYMQLWEWDGTLLRIHDALYAKARALEGRAPTPSLAILDSQSAKGAEKGGRAPIRRALMRARR